MKLRAAAVLAAAGITVGSFVATSADGSPFNPASPLAQKKGKKGRKGKKDVGQIEKRIRLAPRGIGWGLAPAQIASIYDHAWDDQYKELYKTTPIGPQTAALDAELRDKKDLIRRNRIKFGSLQTGVDNTPLKGEYSYANNESMTSTALDGGTMRYFFFFGENLWKVYDEHKLRGNGPVGTSFEGAVLVLTAMLGAEPKRVEPAPQIGRNFDEAHWSDGTTLIRLVNREHEGIVGLVYVEENTQSKLPSLRKNRPTKERIDSQVRDATTKAPPPSSGDKKKKR